MPGMHGQAEEGATVSARDKLIEAIGNETQRVPDPARRRTQHAQAVPMSDWRDKAACLGADVRLFFNDGATRYARAKRVCAMCPVTDKCLSAGEKVPHGVWGGLTPPEREDLFGIKYTNNRAQYLKVNEHADRIAELYQSGLGFRKVSERLGVPISSVKRVVHRRGIARPADRSQRRETERYRELEPQIARLYLSGMSIPQVCKELNCTDYMVKKCIYSRDISRAKDGRKKNEILRMADEGVPHSEITHKLDTTIDYINFVLRQQRKAAEA